MAIKKDREDDRKKNGMKVTDNMGLPDRFSSIITDRAKYYVYMLRSDPEHAQLADRDFQRKLRLLKVDYATKNDYMRSDTIAESITTQIGGRVS